MTDVVVRRGLDSSFILIKNWIWCCWRAFLARDVWTALVNFCKYLTRLCLLVSSSAWAYLFVMKSCSDIRVSADTGVLGVRSASSCGQDLTSSASGMVSSTGGFVMSLITLSGSNGAKPHFAHPARMFFFVSSLSLARLYNDVECSLPIVFVPARSSRSICPR